MNTTDTTADAAMTTTTGTIPPKDAAVRTSTRTAAAAMTAR